jgi:hypothetical protein
MPEIRQRLTKLCSNWEFNAFYLIDKCVNENERQFSRIAFMKNIDEIYGLMIFYGHKEKPKHPEETLQRTLQNMRDKEWVNFYGQGEYELTDEGYKILMALQPAIKYYKKEYKGKTGKEIRDDFMKDFD